MKNYYYFANGNLMGEISLLLFRMWNENFVKIALWCQNKKKIHGNIGCEWVVNRTRGRRMYFNLLYVETVNVSKRMCEKGAPS